MTDDTTTTPPATDGAAGMPSVSDEAAALVVQFGAAGWYDGQKGRATPGPRYNKTITDLLAFIADLEQRAATAPSSGPGGVMVTDEIVETLARALYDEGKETNHPDWEGLHHTTRTPWCRRIRDLLAVRPAPPVAVATAPSEEAVERAIAAFDEPLRGIQFSSEMASERPLRTWDVTCRGFSFVDVVEATTRGAAMAAVWNRARDAEWKIPFTHFRATVHRDDQPAADEAGRGGGGGA